MNGIIFVPKFKTLNMNLKTLLAFSFILIFSSNTFAQDYKQAVGIRISPATPAIKTGITYKYFLNESAAVEGILSLSNGLGVGALYELHNPVNIDNLQWFYGAGAYVASSDKISYVGAMGIIGLDYKFPDIPLNISIDWKPELNIAEHFGFEGSGVGFSARFTF